MTLSCLRRSKKSRFSSRKSSTISVSVSRKASTEPSSRYHRGGYHRVKPGEVYNQRYQVVRQLGWGHYSTVWLVQDVREQRNVVMKILIGDQSYYKAGFDEAGVLKIVRDGQPKSPGRHNVCQLLDDFMHHGRHVCLILEPMGFNVLEIYRGYCGAMPLPLLKRVSKHVLHALQYLHEDCGIIHTGDNILITGSPPTMGQRDVLSEKVLMSSVFKLTDFGAACKMSKRYNGLIQPQAFRSPEVIIGAEWNTKADIWNFGCLMYEFARGAQLFDPVWNIERTGMDTSQTHLAQMVALLGAFPRRFLTSGKKTHEYFDEEGHLLHGAGLYNIAMEDLLPRTDHPFEELPTLADFLSKALIIDPEARWSAAQLLEHCWLQDVE
ncbi:serine protein kinase sky1 [Moniliophthora roreri MCA 2997]|uniref:non-specific serine/threonine protein kinase n=1 Tax=Moniliophthora roreri (strain MCA 2997) TaxID=1381753 RepID=V2XSQ4_MONRO|nr:serine protein kinase sky1 [Moniliophthora roreri MCA 2997]